MFKDSLDQADRRWESQPLFRKKSKPRSSRWALLGLLFISLLALVQILVVGDAPTFSLFQ